MEEADAMVKAASVKIADFQIVGSGLVSVTATGDVAAVMAAVETGKVEVQSSRSSISKRNPKTS